MRDPPRAAIVQGVVALDQSNLAWRLSVLEVPPMLGIWLDSICLAAAIGIHQRSTDKVAVRHRVCIRKRKWIFEYCLDGAPDLLQELLSHFWHGKATERGTYVDDLEALLQKSSRHVWKMMRNTLLGSRVGLVDVNTAHGAAELDRCCFAPAGVLRLATDGVVEDEDTNSSGTTSHRLSANGCCYANVFIYVSVF